jgi:hypothetical protein
VVVSFSALRALNSKFFCTNSTVVMVGMQAREQPWRATFAAPAPGPASQVTGTSQLIPPTSAADCLKAWADWFTSTWDRVAKQSGPYRVFNAFEWNGPGIGSSPICRSSSGDASEAGLAHAIARYVAIARLPFFLLPPYFLAWSTPGLAANAAARLRAVHAAGCAGYEAHGHFMRIARSELYTNLSWFFRNDPFLSRTVKAYLGLNKNETFRKQVTTADIFEAGSSPGGGWHKDTNDPSNMKAIMYLEDVKADNSPFSVLINYDESKLHRCVSSDFRATRKRGGEAPLCGLPYELEATTWDRKLQPQFPNSSVDSYVRGAEGRADRAYAVEVWAPMGSVLFFDSSSIHRGKLNRAKQRVSVTNYYQKPSSQYRRTLFHSGNEFGSFCYKQPYWQAPSHALLPNRSTCRKFCLRDQVDPWSLC